MNSSGREPVSKKRYFDPAFMQREWTHLWRRVWLVAAHASELPSPGSFAVFEIGDESILVVRQAGGRVRAFHNVCRHRGYPLARDDRGTLAVEGTVRCGYHGWQYAVALDGALVHRPSSEDFEDCPATSELGLRHVRCAERLGFVWICLDGEPVAIDDFLAPVAARVAAYRPEALVLASERIVEVGCNWKLSVDVHNEAYHLPTLHPELEGVVDFAGIRLEACPPHAAMTIPLYPQRGDRASQVRAARSRAAHAALDLSSLSDDQLVDKHQVYVFPNVQLNLGPFGLEVYRHRPHRRDPEVSFLDEMTYARPDASPPRSLPVRKRRLRHGDEPLGPVIGADVDLLPHLQRGLRSSGSTGLVLGRREAAIAGMHDTLDAYLAWPLSVGPPA